MGVEPCPLVRSGEQVVLREDGDMLRSTAGGVGVSDLPCRTPACPHIICYTCYTVRKVVMFAVLTYLPACGESGDPGTMTAVPSSAMRSCPAPLPCMGEDGDLAPLSRPLTRPFGTLRSSGSSKDSMTACGPEPSTFTEKREEVKYTLMILTTLRNVNT